MKTNQVSCLRANAYSSGLSCVLIKVSLGHVKIMGTRKYVNTNYIHEEFVCLNKTRPIWLILSVLGNKFIEEARNSY